jgi:hypothetical protein
MRRAQGIAVFVFCLAGAIASGQDEDAVASKLVAAKTAYEKDLGKAREGLVAELKKMAEVRRKAGNLSALEKVESDLKAFEEKGTLPKTISTISTRDYTDAVRVARIRMTTAYAAAVKEYTTAGKTDLAKATQASLDEFKKAKGAGTDEVPDDGFAEGVKFVGTNLQVWASAEKKKKPTVKGNEWQFVVTKRSGNEFTAEGFGGCQWEGTIVKGVVKGTCTKAPQGLKNIIGNNSLLLLFNNWTFAGLSEHTFTRQRRFAG